MPETPSISSLLTTELTMLSQQGSTATSIPPSGSLIASTTTQPFRTLLAFATSTHRPITIFETQPVSGSTLSENEPIESLDFVSYSGVTSTTSDELLMTDSSTLSLEETSTTQETGPACTENPSSTTSTNLNPVLSYIIRNMALVVFAAISFFALLFSIAVRLIVRELLGVNDIEHQAPLVKRP
jgi:hypothetical protein